MQDLIKRYFWVLGGVVVMICAVFGAKAASHIIEAKYLSDPDHPAKVQPLPTQSPMPTKQVRSKDGSLFATRDMFCSECTPAVAPVNTDPSAVSTTTLPLVLLATNVGITNDQSWAAVINTENQRQGSYSIDDQIPGASGKLKVIHFKYIEFENNGHMERLVLAGATVPIAVAEPQPAAEGSGDELQASIDNGIKKIDDNTYEIDKSLVDKVLANPMAVAKGARVVPAVKNGKPDGFKLYAIRPSSVYSKLGLQNGDTLQSINGFELTSADKALEVYTKLREATSLEVEVTRRGQQQKLKYTIR